MKNLIILLSCLLFAGSVYGWGQKGHDVTAYIAECHLTPEAAQKIDKVLNGHSPVYYCNWMDIASHTPEYNYTKTWHYLNIDEGQTLETMPRNPKGDVLTAVTALVAELKAGGLAPEAETEKLKMLIHLVGDMHCPMHTGRLSDIGGNQLKETHAICVGIYEDSPEGTKISYDYVDKYTPVIEQQLVRGGYRLARLLNEIYR